MFPDLRIKKCIFILFIVLLSLSLYGCSVFDSIIGPDEGESSSQPDDNNQPDDQTGTGNEQPPGSNDPGGSQFNPDDPQATLVLSDNVGPSENSLPTKPVRFHNLGTVGYTVSAWSYIPLDSAYTSTPSSASTVAFPTGGASSALSLPLGTYTWCYSWELGDTNGDSMMDYAHAIDTRPVILDKNDSDDVDLSEIVDLSAPANSGVSSGLCMGGTLIEVTPKPAAVTSESTYPPGEMIEAEGVWLGYPGACAFSENEIHWQFNSEGGPITGEAKQYSVCDGYIQYLDVEFEGTYNGNQNFFGGVWVKSYYTCTEEPCYPPFDYPASWTASWIGDQIIGEVDGLGGFSLTIK